MSSVIIMYYSLSSLFTFNCSISEQKEQISNHPVFEEEGEAIDEKGKIIQYVLEKEYFLK